MSEEKIARLRDALAEVEMTWAAAEAAITVAFQAAQSAYGVCTDVRNHWKRAEGDDLCDLAILATNISVRAQSRANEVVHRNSHDHAEVNRMLATEPRFNVQQTAKPKNGIMSNFIALESLKDILDVQSDSHFEQILAELPADLRSMRELAKCANHGGFLWPIKWRSDGEQSTVTTHCTDGVLAKRPMHP